MQESIDWAIAAFTSNPSADDDALVELLTAAGMPPGLAARAVLMLPLAFGRKLLRGMVAAPDEIYEGDRARVLSADPVFAMAERRAEHAGREQMERIALRSSEVNAVNNALQAGSQPGDLIMSAPRTGALDDAEPSPEWAATALAELVRSHGSKLAWEARVFPRELTTDRVQLQLDVVVRGIVESFAGVGATIAAATADAITKLTRASLHVILAAFEGISTDQVEWETWGGFRVCLGPLLRMWSSVTPVEFAPYLDAVKARIVAANLSREVHWHRMFVGVGRDELYGFDELLDNDDWPPGVELLKSWTWPRGEPYALRHFLVLTPHDG